MPISAHSFRAIWPYAILASFLAYLVIAGIAETRTGSDFEVFHMAGQRALARSADLYEATSPIEDRRFLYPPSGAMLLAPIALLPNSFAAAAFTLFKGVALVLLGWGSCRFAGVRLKDPREMAVACALAAAAIFRPIDSEFLNGQINILVVLLAVGGVWLLSRSRKAAVAGVVAIAAAAAIKLTPMLLVAVPFLQRRWSALAGTLAVAAFLIIATPLLWFGPAPFQGMLAEYRQRVGALSLNAKFTDEQVSFYEVAMFTLAQCEANPEDYKYEDGRLYCRTDSGWERSKLEEVGADHLAKPLWWTLALLTGLGFLGMRFALFGRKGPDWTWDLAALCVLMLLLAPLVRKAHLVILIYPAIWTSARLVRMAADGGGWRALWRRRPGLLGLAIAGGVCFWTADDIPIHVPGVFPIPYHPSMFVACLILLGLLAWLGAGEARGESRPCEPLPAC